MEFVVLFALVALGFFAIAKAAGRAHTVVQLERGSARLVKGQPPPGLVADLKGVAKMSPQTAGRVELRGQGDTLKVTTPGLSEGEEQRVRNVVLLHKTRIRSR